MVEIIVHGSAHSGLIELAAAEMGSTKAGLVTKGQFNEQLNLFQQQKNYSLLDMSRPQR